MQKYYNIGILAHVDAGKTTLTEQMMLYSGAIRKAGSVDDGTTVTDKLSVEKRRGISVISACADYDWKGNKICIIDTPGHTDFAGEVERCLGVLDGAVMVISAAEGVQANTEVIYEALAKMGIPVIFVINKIDRIGSRISQVLKEIEKKLTPDIYSYEVISGEGTDDCSVTVSEEEKAEMEQMRKELGSISPVLFTSAKNSVGIKEVLDAVVDYLPDSSALSMEELSGLVFKIEHDRTMGRIAYIRLFGGTLKNREMIGEEKITQIRTFSAGKQVDTGALNSGETGVVFGLSSLKIGDYIGAPPPIKRQPLTVPLFMATVKPESKEREPELMKALTELSAEDPLLDFKTNTETHEMYVNITGTIQEEILTDILAERYNLNVSFTDTSVIYKETPAGIGIGFEAYTMPKPCWAIVELKIEPLPKGSGIVFESVIKEKQMLYRYQHHVELSVMETKAQGIYGWEVTDAKITLTGGEHHHIHTHPLDFFLATPIAFMRALTNSGSVLLEPFIELRMTADEALAGKLIGRILEMRGVFDSPQINSGKLSMRAEVPVADSRDFTAEFRSMTSGKGVITTKFLDYRACPSEYGKTLPRRGINPLDRAKWILFKRGAIQ